jgi:hypothetical protein
VTGTLVASYHLARTWGSTPLERSLPLPGDELVAGPKLRTTHAVTVAVPPQQVWPWLRQLGWSRGGWYTNRWLERVSYALTGRSSDRLLPGIDDLRVGDRIPDGTPRSGRYFTVAYVDPPRCLVLQSTTHLFPRLATRPGVRLDWVWTWDLSLDPDGHTRVVLRTNGHFAPVRFHLAYLALIVPVDGVMACSHLRGLGRRAERGSTPGGAHGRSPTRKRLRWRP